MKEKLFLTEMLKLAKQVKTWERTSKKEKEVSVGAYNPLIPDGAEFADYSYIKYLGKIGHIEIGCSAELTCPHDVFYDKIREYARRNTLYVITCFDRHSCLGVEKSSREDEMLYDEKKAEKIERLYNKINNAQLTSERTEKHAKEKARRADLKRKVNQARRLIRGK